MQIWQRQKSLVQFVHKYYTNRAQIHDQNPKERGCMTNINWMPSNASTSSTEKIFTPLRVDKVLLLYPFAVSHAYDLDRTLEDGAFIEAPIGLGYISAYVKACVQNVEVEVFDANAMAIKHILQTRRCDMQELWGLLKDKLEEFKPDLVGVSCLFHSIAHSAHQSCALVKQMSRSIVTVMGGNYPAGSPDVVLDDDCVDFIVLSEGERACAQLIEALRQGRSPISSVDGIRYKQAKIQEIFGATSVLEQSSGADVVYASDTKFAKNIDDYPWPDRSSFDMEFYATQARHFAYRTLDRNSVRIATLTATRGCPFKCTFCSSKDFWGQQIRYRSPKDVVGEMKFLIETYGVNTFVFNDDNMMFNRRNILELCNEITKAGVNVNWMSGGGIQVSSMKPDVIAALVANGFKQFNLAIESGDKKTLKKIKKPLSVGVAEEVIETIRRHEGTWVCSNFVTGFYFQTLSDIRSDLEYAGKLDLDWRAIFEFTALPGTEDYNTCVNRGYIKPWTVADSRDGIATHPLSTENFTYSEVQNLNYLANLRYNFLENRNLIRDPMRALGDFAYVLEMVPDHAIAHYASGLAHAQLGKYEKAVNSIKLAVDLVEESKKLEESKFEASIAIISAQIRWVDLFEKFGINPLLKLDEYRALQKAV
jgi:magnesium-protoporphyrin IX monomethyl ester (oxidative) cyclase